VNDLAPMFVPSLNFASVHVAPKSDETNIFPLYEFTVMYCPSADIDKPFHEGSALVSVCVMSAVFVIVVHVVPPSVVLYKSEFVAATIIKFASSSAIAAISYCCVLPGVISTSLHLLPEFLEIQMCPFKTTPT